MKSKPYLPLLYLSPFLLFFAVFFCFPFFSGIYYSFTNYDLSFRSDFVGLDNYRQLFDASSPYFSSFWTSVKNTFFFMAISVPLLIAIPFLIANLIVKTKHGDRFTPIFYVSCMFSIASAMLIWFSMLGSKGLITYLGHSLFGVKIAWLTTVPPAWVAIISSTVWWTIGLNLVIYIAAIHAVPTELYESASLDGAGSFRKMISITLPSVKHQLVFTAVTTLIASSNLFGQPALLTKGGPGEATLSATMYIRNTAFGSSIPAGGLGSAMGITFGVIIIIITVLGMNIANRIAREA